MLCGDGVLALRECRHDDEGEPFAPGERWRSIRFRLGLDLEDEVYRLVQRLEETS